MHDRGEPKPIRPLVRPRSTVSGVTRALVRAWLSSKESELEATPRPANSADQRLPGPNPMDILVVGGGAAAGWGVSTHELGFTGALARRLRGATQRGVHVRTAIDVGVSIADAPDLVRASRGRFDELRVVVLGVTETFRMVEPAAWRDDIERVLDALEPSAEHPAVLVGIQPISSIPVYHGGLSHWLDRHAAALNRQTAAAAARPHVAFAPLPAPPRVSISRYRGPADYDFWATRVVDAAEGMLHAPRERTAPASYDPATEQRRAQELARLGIVDERANLAVDSLVRFTRAVFDMGGADLVLLGPDRAWSVSSVSLNGPDRPDHDRDRSFTSYAIESRGACIVPDAHEDPRFQTHDGVVGEPGIRFFAGYPVEGPTGERIGVLAMYDTVPREFDEASQELLHALARQVEQALRNRL